MSRQDGHSVDAKTFPTRNAMGRMDGDGVGMEIVDPRGRIAQLELEIQRLERQNSQLQNRCDTCLAEIKVLSGNLEMAEVRTAENEQANSIIGRGYRSVTVYADGTVEVDRSFDDDDSQPPARRTL